MGCKIDNECFVTGGLKQLVLQQTVFFNLARLNYLQLEVVHAHFKRSIFKI